MGAVTLAGWLILVAVDFLNGGGSSNLPTVTDYLPFVALAPLAFGIRSSGVSVGALDRVMQATLIVATAFSLLQFAWLQPDRVGGLNLNPIPYSFAILLWGIVLLSRGLEQGRAGLPSVAIALLAIVPIALAGSRLVWVCAAVAYPLVTVLWSIAAGRFRLLAPFLAGAVLLLVLAAVSGFVPHRISFLWAEIADFISTGTIKAQSFGHRLELVRSGFRAFLEAPILGHGITGSVAAAAAHMDPAGPDISMHGHLHNEYIAHMVGYGVFGLLFLALYFWVLVRLALGCGMPAYRRAGLTIAVALALYCTAEIHFHMDPISGSMALVAGLLLAFRSDDTSAASASR